MFVGSVIFSILLVVSGFLYYQSYKRKQQNRLNAELLREKESGLKAVFDATEEERKRIAKDLHDGVGQQLSAIKLGFEGFLKRVGEKIPSESEKLSSLSKIVDDTATEVRTLSHQMMPRALQEMGLMPAIDEMLGKSLGNTSIEYTFEHYQVEGKRFNERVEVGIYRIAQELVNNIIKHSGANLVMVQLFRNKDYLILIVEDNGQGFHPGSKKDGIGLMNINTRLGTVNGDVIWEPSPESGTVATVRVPVE
jgi:signal transduction histidine kinase